MIIQGNNRATWRLPDILPSVVVAVLLLLLTTACSRAVQTREATDFSPKTPDELLFTFLESEQAVSPVKFTFTGEAVVKTGGVHNFRGVAVFRRCSALRLKLLGPLGYTLLEYVNVAGKPSLLANQLTPEGDAQALEDLMNWMEVLTLALTDRCQPIDSYHARSHDADQTIFSVPTRRNAHLQFTLDRLTGSVIQQSVTGGDIQDVTVDYSDYHQENGYRFPGMIRIGGSEMPVLVTFVVKKWEAAVDLPDNFFAED